MDLHRHVVHPDLCLQATIEFLASVPTRRLKRLLIIPGYGNNSNGPRAGIQSCLILALLAVANVQVERLEGRESDIPYISFFEILDCKLLLSVISVLSIIKRIDSNKGHYKITPNENWNYDLIQLMSSLYDDRSTYEIDAFVA